MIPKPKADSLSLYLSLLRDSIYFTIGVRKISRRGERKGRWIGLSTIQAQSSPPKSILTPLLLSLDSPESTPQFFSHTRPLPTPGEWSAHSSAIMKFHLLLLSLNSPLCIRSNRRQSHTPRPRIHQMDRNPQPILSRKAWKDILSGERYELMWALFV